MPDRPHHTAKMKSCVEKVMSKGKDESRAYAICTASMKKAGEPIFVSAEQDTEIVFIEIDEQPIVDEIVQELTTARLSTMDGKVARHVHLIGATGQIRTASYEGREHLVVPVIALLEGVIH